MFFFAPGSTKDVEGVHVVCALGSNLRTLFIICFGDLAIFVVMHQVFVVVELKQSVSEKLGL